MTILRRARVENSTEKWSPKSSCFPDVLRLADVSRDGKVNMPTQQADKPGAVVEQRSMPTLDQVKTIAQAIFSGKYVEAMLVAQRMDICRKCDKLRVTPAGVAWCGACGCRVSRKDREITNLVAYEENLPKWGCKHPKRKEGKGWPVEANNH